jgi:hypothetical protein
MFGRSLGRIFGFLMILVTCWRGWSQLFVIRRVHSPDQPHSGNQAYVTVVTTVLVTKEILCWGATFQGVFEWFMGGGLRALVLHFLSRRPIFFRGFSVPVNVVVA